MSTVAHTSTLALSAAFASAALSGAPFFPAGFKSRMFESPARATIFARWGGTGPAVVLLHGFGETGEMWGPLAAELAKTNTVIVPDLRGMGSSSHPPGGYDKKTQAIDIRAVVTALGFDHAAVVGHDIGNMVAYAYAAKYRDKVDRLVVMDAQLPGIADWDQVSHSPRVWHFYFYGPDVERLVQGRERIYLDRFWNELSAHPERIDEPTREYFASFYSLPGAMHSAFEQFHAFPQDAADNRIDAGTKLTIPVLAVGGEKSYGARIAASMSAVAIDVRGAIVPDSGHWLMEENPKFTIALVAGFIREQSPKSP